MLLYRFALSLYRYVLSTVYEKAADNALVGVIINMYENNFTLEQIAVATKKSVEEIKAIIEDGEPILA